MGTISPSQTWHALVCLLVYASAYVLTVHLLRERRQVERFVQILVAVGGLLAFLSLLDYMAGEASLSSGAIPRWRRRGCSGRSRIRRTSPRGSR